MNSTRVCRDERFLALAVVTSLGATCARRRVGCVLTDVRGHVLATGYNGTASGTTHCIDEHCPGADAPSGTGLDLCRALHAEQNALMQCRDVWSIRTCYVTASPCMTCVKLLMNTSCRHVVFVDRYPHSEAESLWLGSSPLRTWAGPPDDYNLLYNVLLAARDVR